MTSPRLRQPYELERTERGAGTRYDETRGTERTQAEEVSRAPFWYTFDTKKRVQKKRMGKEERVVLMARKSGIAVKRDPKLWERSKKAACKEAGLCAHSARKMQWATRYYKSHGGTYVGPLSPTNRLSRWTRQRWRTHSGRKSEGTRRYLPDAAWKRLSPSQIRRTDRAKREGTRRGRQWVPQPKDVVAATRSSRTASLNVSDTRK